jgi:hypothetical protein
MDDETVRLLQALPADLRERGWRLSAAESDVLQWETVRYTAVYVRPFDAHLDRESPSSAAFDQRTRQQDAIRRMREADTKRRRRR